MIELRKYENEGNLKEEYNIFRKKLTKLGNIIKKVILNEFKKQEFKIDYSKILRSVKSFDSFLRTIYKSKNFEDPFKNVSDLLTIRIIIYYKSQIEKCFKIISRLFEIFPEKDHLNKISDKSDVREGMIFNIRLSKNMKNKKVYDEFKDFSCKIQITTIIHYTWDLIQNSHIYKYRPIDNKISTKFKRKLRNLSAQLEIADNELDSIHKIFTYSLIDDIDSSKMDKKPLQMIRKIMENRDLFVSTCIDYLKNKKFGELLEFCDESIKIDSKYENAWLYRGITLTELENFQDAESSFNKALIIDPKSNSTLYDLGHFYERTRNFEKAIEILEKLLKLYPSDKPALKKLADIYFITKNIDKSILTYNKLLELDPNSITAFNNLGVLYQNLGNFEKARELFEEAIKLDPTNSGFLNNLALVSFNLKEYDKSLIYLNKSIKINPNNKFSWYNKGRIFIKLQNIEEAIVCFDKALEIDPYQKDALNEKGLALIDLKKYEEAIRYFDKTLEINPNFIVALANKGVTLINLKRLEEAEPYLQKVLNLDPNNANSLYNLACLESLKNNDEKALGYLKQAINIDNSYIDLAKNEKDFKSIRNNLKFQILLGVK